MVDTNCQASRHAVNYIDIIYKDTNTIPNEATVKKNRLRKDNKIAFLFSVAARKMLL